MPRALRPPEGDTSLLDQVLAVVLPGDYLTPECRLACLGTSKGVAELVFRHTPRTQLNLTLGGAAAAAAGGSSSSSSSRSARAAVRAAQQLAAQSCNVALAMHGGLTSPAACLWQSITSLRLHGVQLLPKDLSSRSQLQLHKLPRLHTLSLAACRMDSGSRPATTTHQGPATAHPLSRSLRTLECMECTPASAALLRMVVSLVDPGQLQTITTDDSAVIDLLAQLPALQELQLLPNAGEHAVEDEADTDIDDHAFQQLLQHPGLRRVSLPQLDLQQDHSAQPCSWASLQLIDGVSVQCLAALPLARIQSCTVQRAMSDEATKPPLSDALVDRAVRNVSNCPRFVFQPAAKDCWWAPTVPTYHVLAFDCTSSQAGQLLQLAMRHMAGGALIFHRNAPLPRALMSATLAAAPATLSAVCLPVWPAEFWDGPNVVGQSVLASLPTHVSHVMLHAYWPHLSAAELVYNLCWYLKGVTRPLRLTLLHSNQEYVWSAAMKQRVRSWLALHASSQVQVDFQRAQRQEGGIFAA